MKKQQSLAEHKPLPRKQKSAIWAQGVDHLLKNGPPVETAMIVRYHPETNENIYTFTNEQPKAPYEPPWWKPIVAQDSTNE